jgi:polyhydroxybutyrate depolymerase
MLHTLTHDPGSGPRKSLLYAPEKAHNKPLPLVLMLHGTGSSAVWTLEETRWQDLAEREGFLLLVPEGTRADQEQPPGFLKNPLVWNDGAVRPGLGQPDSDDVAFIDELLDDVLNVFPVDARHIFVTGFSNGAGMTFRLGTELCHRFRALAPVAGLCSVRNPRPMTPLPTLFMIGAADPLIPFDGGEVVLPWLKTRVHRPPVRDTLERWAEALGCPREPVLVSQEEGVRVEAYGPGREGVQLRVWSIEGLGHHWPGGRGGVSQRLVGPASDRVNANEVIWAFFRAHTQGALRDPGLWNTTPSG